MSKMSQNEVIEFLRKNYPKEFTSKEIYIAIGRSMHKTIKSCSWIKRRAHLDHTIKYRYRIEKERNGDNEVRTVNSFVIYPL